MIPLTLCLLACLGGLGAGEAFFALQRLNGEVALTLFSGTESIWLKSAVVGLVWAWVWAGLWRWGFGFSWRSGLRLGTLGSLSGLLGFFWFMAIRMPIPPPHDAASRKIEILLGGILILAVALPLLLGTLGLAFSRAFQSMQPASQARRLACLLALVYFVSGLWSGPWHMTGDAPHYLLITDSVVHDQDLDLANQYGEGRYRGFYERGELGPQEPASGTHQYSEHKILLSLLVAPGYALAGPLGARALLALLAAAGAGLLFWLARRRGWTSQQALLAFAILAFSAAWWTHSQVFLVELIGGLALLLWYAALIGELGAIWGLLALASMPWLSLRFYLPCLVASLSLVWVWRKQGNKAWLPLFVSGLSFAAALFLDHLHYQGGSLGSYAQRSLSLSDLVKPSHMLRYASGLLIDQEYGLLPLAPGFALAVFALRRPQGREWALLAVLASYLGLVASFPWWYGDMAPNRYLVELTPFLALAVASVLRKHGARLVFVLILAAHFGLGLLTQVLPWLCYSKQDGANTLLKVLQAPLGLNLTRYLPAFMIDRPLSYVWLAALCLAAWAYARLRLAKAKGV